MRAPGPDRSNTPCRRAGGTRAGCSPGSSSHSKPAWRSVLLRPLIAISSVRPSAPCSAASGSEASSRRTQTLSERISPAIARSAPRHSVPVAPGSEPEVSTITAIAAMLCEWMEGELGRSLVEGAHHERGDGAAHLAVTEPDAVGDTACEQPRHVKRVAEPLGVVAKSRRYATRSLFVLTGARTSSADRPRSRRRRGRPRALEIDVAGCAAPGAPTGTSPRRGPACGFRRLPSQPNAPRTR